MNYIWVFEPFWVLKTTYVILEMFEYLTNWVTKTVYVFLKPIVSYSFWYMKNWLLSKPSILYL